MDSKPDKKKSLLDEGDRLKKLLKDSNLPAGEHHPDREPYLEWRDKVITLFHEVGIPVEKYEISDYNFFYADNVAKLMARLKSLPSQKRRDDIEQEVFLVYGHDAEVIKEVEGYLRSISYQKIVILGDLAGENRPLL